MLLGDPFLFILNSSEAKTKCCKMLIHQSIPEQTLGATETHKEENKLPSVTKAYKDCQFLFYDCVLSRNRPKTEL